MPTYWDAFLSEYPYAEALALPIILEAFWRYVNNEKGKADKLMIPSAPSEVEP